MFRAWILWSYFRLVYGAARRPITGVFIMLSRSTDSIRQLARYLRARESARRASLCDSASALAETHVRNGARIITGAEELARYARDAEREREALELGARQERESCERERQRDALELAETCERHARAHDARADSHERAGRDGEAQLARRMALGARKRASWARERAGVCS